VLGWHHAERGPGLEARTSTSSQSRKRSSSLKTARISGKRVAADHRSTLPSSSLRRCSSAMSLRTCMPIETDLIHRRVGAISSLSDRGRHGAHGKDPTTRYPQLAVGIAQRSRVKYRHSWNATGCLEAVNLCTGDRRARVAGGCSDDADGGVIA
jgi:hypothetical protein